jgi:hypothetical protein
MLILIDIGDKAKPRLHRALIASFEAMRDRVPYQEIVRALETGGLAAVIDLLDGIEDDLGPVIQEIDDVIRESGIATASMMPAAAMVNLTHPFDFLNRRTLDFIEKYRYNLVQQIADETRAAIRQNLIVGEIAGQNPRVTARMLRDTIGLTDRQELAVRNYRRALEELDRDALQRALRDRRFDGTVSRAIRNKQRLTKHQIDTMVGRYRTRMINHRAEVIARTEALRATSVGNRAAMQQMITSGALDASQVRRQWVYTQDARTRAAHRSVASLNPGGITLDGVYQTALGPLRYPRDPNGSAANTVQCRCTERYFVAETT